MDTDHTHLTKEVHPARTKSNPMNEANKISLKKKKKTILKLQSANV